MPVSALNEDGQPVDWWFAYKLPTLPLPDAPYAEYKGMTQAEQNQYKEAQKHSVGQTHGTEYLYCDANSPALPSALSSHGQIPANILETSALVNTIQQLRYAAEKHDPQIGWFCYNDEHPKLDHLPIPGIPADNFNFGHTKGVLAFDLRTDTAFWLLHSWPCYPSISITPVAPPSPLFGQTFLCISLKDVSTADAIAKVFHAQSQPQITDMSLPWTMDVEKYPHLVQFATDVPRAIPPIIVPLGSSTPSDATFYSLQGTAFRLFAKSKDWLVPATDPNQKPKDLYSDLIGPSLCVDLDVETWQAGEPDQDSDSIHTTEDIQWIDLNPLGLDIAWNFIFHDHAKWAVSRDLETKQETDWVIVADINRIDSQYKRGGVGVAFQNQVLAHSLHSISKMVIPSPPDSKVIEDAPEIMLPEDNLPGPRMTPDVSETGYAA